MEHPAVLQAYVKPIITGCKFAGKSALNRGEWKKKFVTLTNDGKLTYHQSLKEYMDNGQGKEVRVSIEDTVVLGYGGVRVR